jgi:hypothetical protein
MWHNAGVHRFSQHLTVTARWMALSKLRTDCLQILGAFVWNLCAPGIKCCMDLLHTVPNSKYSRSGCSEFRLYAIRFDESGRDDVAGKSASRSPARPLSRGSLWAQWSVVDCFHARWDKTGLQCVETVFLCYWNKLSWFLYVSNLVYIFIPPIS